MLQTEIKRVKFETPVIEDDGLLPLVRDEARELLGYDHRPPEMVPTCWLRRALAELEIDILDWRDVLRYKLEARQAEERVQLAKEVGADDPPGWETAVAWEVQPIDKFKGFIPAHVLHKAVEIKRHSPQTALWIEALTVGRDPFLYVSTNANRYDSQAAKYYIELWNEPSFEAAR